MELVNKDGSLAAAEFFCNDSGHFYSIRRTESTYKGDNPFRDSAFNAKDTIKRDDGKTRTFTRLQMAERFKNVVPSKFPTAKKKELKKEEDPTEKLYKKYNLKKTGSKEQ